jgi:alpha-mannosidase
MTALGESRGAWHLHVVPHTHWDREWYLPLEAFRIRLAHTIDEVLDVLEADERMCFTLDGQSVLLEDYVQYRPSPEQRQRLSAALATGRLAAGPGYVQPDEILVGGESLVRNLLVGMSVSRRFGAEPAMIGYSPDSFGHPGQLPQILSGFGIDHLIFFRGLGDDGVAAGAVMWWRGPDGSEVLAVPMLGGYGNLASIGVRDIDGTPVTDPTQWPVAAAAHVRSLLDHWGDRYRANGLRDVLAGNGVDHRRIQPNLVAMLDEVVQRVPGTSYRVCRYQDYVQTVRAQAPSLHLRTITGEQVSGREAQVTRSVNSTRLELKQANQAAEQLLQSSETLASLATLRGVYDYPHDALEVAWRHLLRAQPHDSISGCSVDEVHRDMRHRFDVAHEIATRIGQEALAALAGEGRDAVWHWAGEPGPRRSLVNVLPWARRRSVALPLPRHLRDADGVLARTDVGELPAQLVGSGEHRQAVVVADLPAFGALTVELLAGEAAGEHEAWAAGDMAIENELLRVAAAADGTLTVTDKGTGRTWPGLHRFEDVGDRGDEYSFCPVEGEEPWTSKECQAQVRVIQRGPVRAELEVRLSLPLRASLSADRRRRVGRATCSVTTTVRLEAGVDRVELSTLLVNRASDHRLRVLFPDPTADPDRVRAQSTFAVVERPARPLWNDEWREPPTLTNQTAGVVAAGDLCLMTRGLPEYEAIPHDGGGVDLALTLVRSVGWLSRDDLSTRHGGAGPQVPTPDAQGLGERRCEYALSVRGGLDDAALVRAGDDYRVDAADAPGRVVVDDLLRVTGEGFACSALKGAEDGDGVVLRLYNPGQGTAWVQVETSVGALERCRLDETAGVAVSGRVDLAPFEIVTLRVRDASRHGEAQVAANAASTASANAPIDGNSAS